MHELPPDSDSRTAIMHPNEPEEGVTAPGFRLKTAIDFLNRNLDLTNLTPLQRTIIEQALGLFLGSGKAPVDEVSSGVVVDPPHDIKISEDNRQDEVVAGIMGLRDLGIINLIGEGRDAKVIFDSSKPVSTISE